MLKHFIHNFRFIEFMKGFSSPHMEIAFSAERSIQDAITELSEAESYTVIISYSLMFLYVAIALGKIKELRTFLVSSIGKCNGIESMP